MNPDKKTASIAGLFYVIVVVTGMIHLAYVPSKLIVWDNATITFNNIVANETLFRLGMLIGFICYTAFLLLPIVLYKLLNPVNKTYALLMIVFAVVSVPISPARQIHCLTEKTTQAGNIHTTPMGLLSAILGNAGTISQAELTKQYGQLLTEGEEIELGFKLIRDTFIFTSKRLILVDKQGLTGSKTEYKSIAYKSISKFSIETAGTFDLEAELKIWVSSEVQPSITKQFNKSVNVYDVQKVLAHHILK